ncbi:hypothetical protein H5410_020803 [Solanum commersonii]|uniref:Uncharacterized protein n=1 Tax=Solanum commersonii TaxID=4109 RepID=A0A9J5ZA52_SOLCO|nr:hypothetical protein H5410_020803 [Solanum commersonii]
MSVEEKGVTSKSLASSRGTPAHRHNSVIKIGKGKEVCLCLALIDISCLIRSPRSMLLWDMIAPRQDALGWYRMDSFWDGIMVMVMKLNQKRAAILKALFSMGPYLDPPRGGIGNQWSQPVLQFI